MPDFIRLKFKFFTKGSYVYLDNAATTQVPTLVFNKIRDSLEFRGNPSRSSHRFANRSAEILEESRMTVAGFIGAAANEVVFTNNTTDSINLAISAISELFKAGDEIIFSVAEHHSNLLPYHNLARRGVKLITLNLKDGLVDMQDMKRKISPKTKLVAIQHCSNVLGNINALEEVRAVLAKYPKCWFLVDGAQAVAHIPVDVKKIKCDFYAFSGHKMYGPDGIGVLYVNEAKHRFIQPIKVGGGTVKDVVITTTSDQSYVTAEYHAGLIVLEGGTPNVSGAAGLAAAVDFLQNIGFEKIRKHEIDLTKKLLNGLKTFSDLKVYGPADVSKKIGVVSMGVADGKLFELGEFLSHRNVCIRYGSHCAFPLANELGQETLRVSFALYNDESDVEAFLKAVDEFYKIEQKIVVNPYIEYLKNIKVDKQKVKVASEEGILALVSRIAEENKGAEVKVMAGHFMGVPDVKTNTFIPSIKEATPERLWSLLDEFGMTSFPLYTWTVSCRIVSELKKKEINAKVNIIANDITGINELRLTKNNTDNKTALDYRNELAQSFLDGVYKDYYLPILGTYGLTEEDIVMDRGIPIFKESLLRAGLKKFVDGNKEDLEGVIDYEKNAKGNVDLAIGILENSEIKNCTFDTFHSVTGGKYCIVEVVAYLSYLVGKSGHVSFDYLPESMKSPISKTRNNIVVMFPPAMCENAISKGAELYIKLMLREFADRKFTFVNIPLGPKAPEHLKKGVDAEVIKN